MDTAQVALCLVAAGETIAYACAHADATRIDGTAGVALGVRSVDEACERYGLSLEEFAGWQRAVDRSGMPGLRVTRIKQYRDQYERQQRY